MTECIFSLMRVRVSLRKLNLLSGQNMGTQRVFKNAEIEIVTPQKIPVL